MRFYDKNKHKLQFGLYFEESSSQTTKATPPSMAVALAANSQRANLSFLSIINIIKNVFESFYYLFAVATAKWIHLTLTN